MKKYILKQMLTVTVLLTPAHLIIANPEKDDIAFVQSVVEHTRDFVEFSTEWTHNFFDTRHRGSFAIFTKQLTDATAKFDQIVVQPLCSQVTRLRNSPYHQALAIGQEIACMLHKQANHVCSILNKNLRNKNATFVGLALLETNKYTSKDMIHELERKFNKFVHALERVNPQLAAHAQVVGKNMVEARRQQHDMSMSEKQKALKHRLKC